MLEYPKEYTYIAASELLRTPPAAPEVAQGPAEARTAAAGHVPVPLVHGALGGHGRERGARDAGRGAVSGDREALLLARRADDFFEYLNF